MLETIRSETEGLRPPIVLVVEDETLIRMAMAVALRRCGFVAIEAANADEAMDAVHAGVAPDVLLTDIRMPGLFDGLHLAALLEVYFPDLLVFITSGHLATSDLKLRVNFFPKPIDPERTAWTISEALIERNSRARLGRSRPRPAAP